MTLQTVEFSSPVFFDKKVQDLNTELATLGWISKLYPIAWKGEDNEGEFPEVYYNDGSNKNLRVMPDGNSISFFQIEGDITEIEDYWYNIPLSLTVWTNLKLVYPTKKYDYTAELISDVLTILRNNSCNDMVISTDQVLEEFSYLQKMLKQNTMRPYTAFKITFSITATAC
jgi:hypothetical protein